MYIIIMLDLILSTLFIIYYIGKSRFYIKFTKFLIKILIYFRRKKSPPQFETLSEYTDESDESKKSTPCEDRQEKQDGGHAQLPQPHPIEIENVDDDLCEISSSSEIEIGGSIADADSVATEDLDPHNGSLLYQDIDVDIETPCSATNNVEMSGFGCRASDLATARKLEFKVKLVVVSVRHPITY